MQILIGIATNNGNQIAKRVNGGGRAYREDVAEMNERLTEIRILFGKALAVLCGVPSLTVE
ncbi:MAG: hypothetical protein LBP73_01575 [Clostridiales Family XIII bacterium]|nr:hypothetical protein [Clostridiales Family XIII bacterium]